MKTTLKQFLHKNLTWLFKKQNLDLSIKQRTLFKQENIRRLKMMALLVISINLFISQPLNFHFWRQGLWEQNAAYIELFQAQVLALISALLCFFFAYKLKNRINLCHKVATITSLFPIFTISCLVSLAHYKIAGHSVLFFISILCLSLFISLRLRNYLFYFIPCSSYYLFKLFQILKAEGSSPVLFTNTVIFLICMFAISRYIYALRVNQLRNLKIIEDKTNELENKVKELEQFAHLVTHDIKTPLRTINSFANLLKRGYEEQLDEDGKVYLQFLVSGSKDLALRTEEILQTAKNGNKLLASSLIDLNLVLEKVILDIDSNIKESNTQIVLETLPKINGNQTDFIRLFQNLISNAIRYKHPNREPEIKISAKVSTQEVILSVEDNGIGIPKQKHSQIFEQYHQVSNQQNSGYGLGLFICKKIVHNYKGKIWVESEPGKGSNFQISIPAA